jgi:hypothetical protein
MKTHIFGVLGLDLESEWQLGAVTFKPAGSLAVDVSRMRVEGSIGSAREVLNEKVDEIVKAWSGHATAHVESESTEAAVARVQETLAVLRFLIRGFVDVNRDLHKVGLTEEVALTIREVVVLHAAGGTGAGWHRVGGPVEVTVTRNRLNEWASDPRVRFLGRVLAVEPGDRTTLGGRSITALQVLDSGFLSGAPTVKALFYAIAVEAVFAIEDEELRRTQGSFAIARRFAYLACANQCCRAAAPCPYISSIPKPKQLVQHAIAASSYDEWVCEAFLLIASPSELLSALRATPMFTTRNEIAHEGVTTLDAKQIGSLRGIADTAVNAAIIWFAEHPDSTIAGLDAEIEHCVSLYQN